MDTKRDEGVSVQEVSFPENRVHSTSDELQTIARLPLLKNH
jgi:hypothetical protein